MVGSQHIGAISQSNDNHGSEDEDDPVKQNNNETSMDHEASTAGPGRDGIERRIGNGHSDEDNEDGDSISSSDQDDEKYDDTSDSDDGESSSDSGSSSRDDNDGDDSENDDDADDDKNTGTAKEDDSESQGLSKYELLRLQRIKRNKERLIQLGLESKDGGGVLGKKKTHSSGSKNKKQRNSVNSSDTPAVPTRRSRRSSAGTVASYAEPPNSIRSMLGSSSGKRSSSSGVEVGGIPGDDQKQRTGRRREKGQKDRIPRFIYDEFKSIQSHKRETLKEAEKNVKRSEKELSYWRRRSEIEEKKAEKERELQEALKRMEEERQLYGGRTGREFLQELDRRIPEMVHNIRHYDYIHMSKDQVVEAEAKRLENENKLKLLDAISSYPKAMKDAVSTLNSCLLERAPKDPPPPRRSKRKAIGDEAGTMEKPTKKKKGEKSTKHVPKPIPEDSSEGINSSYHSEAITKAAAQASVSQAETLLKSTTSDSPEGKATGKSKRKRDLNVGGWISPPFATSLDRSWLERDVPHSDFDLKAYVPQVGDTVLYYPEGHKEFLKKFPDHLAAKRITRLPLWERARKEQAKVDKPDVSPNASDKIINGKCSSTKNWWNEDWLSGIENSSFGLYPIICRVEKTQAEFPPDPYREHRVKQEGQIIWKLPSNMTKAGKRSPLRLAVMLKPLTSVMPPTWTESGPVDKTPLDPPPTFTAVTFPSSLQPFLVPLSWAYILNQSLAVDDEVVIPQSKATQKGRVQEFANLGDDYGNFRLEDKRSYIEALFPEFLEGGDGRNLMGASNPGSRGFSPNSAIPHQDAFVLGEFLTSFRLSESTSTRSTTEDPTFGFVEFIRCTLPLWNGVSVLRNVYDRRTYWSHSWELRPRKTRKEADTSSSAYLAEFMKEGIPRSLDNVLRLKIECSIEDLTSENEQLQIFKSLITDEIAAFYSCAVPVSMCFDRVLKRLRDRGTTETEDAKCYYRTFDAVLADVTVIQDNCCLYNDPESDVVKAADEALPAAKRFLTNVASRHVKERAEKIKADNEKKNFVMLNCNSTALLEPDDSSKVEVNGSLKSQSKMHDPFKEPFKGDLYREWLQLTHPDISWRKERKQAEYSYPQWVPQAGDIVLYSRSLHAQFVKGHFKALHTSQCVLPQFQRDEGGKESSDSWKSHDEVKHKATTDQLSEALGSGWIAGKIVWIRAVFPRSASHSAEQNGGIDNRMGGFKTDSPVLALGVRFPGYELVHKNRPVVLHWRPCFYSFDLKGATDIHSICCGSCGVQAETSFLRPAWGSHFGDTVAHGGDILKSNAPSTAQLDSPNGIPQQDLSALQHCFNLLKRRCLNKVPADHIDPNITSSRVKNGFIPSVVKVGSRALPEFDESLKVDFENLKASKPVSTRGIRKEPDACLTDLAQVNFLPPWFPQTIRAGDPNVGSGHDLHDSLSPYPRLCLELILIRLKNGYYRQKLAVQNDLIEAYLTSVLLCLAPSAMRKKNPLSIKKIANILASKKYSAESKVPGKKTKSTPELHSIKSHSSSKSPAGHGKRPSDPGGLQSLGDTVGKSTSKNSSGPNKKKAMTDLKVANTGKSNDHSAASVHAAENSKQKAHGPILDEEETALLSRVESVRRLYATALVCLSETSHVQYLFGLASLHVSRQNLRQKVMSISNEDAEAARARETLVNLVAAIGRDPCQNRLPLTLHHAPTVKLKFFIGAERIKTEVSVCLPPVQSFCVPTPNGQEDNAPPPNQAITSGSTERSTITVVQDRIDFHLSDYEGDPFLTRLFFGKPGRMFPCVRCQVYKRSMLTCRVRKGHSNLDFDLAGHFRASGGLDGLFNILFQRPPAPEAAATMEVDATTEEPNQPDNHAGFNAVKKEDANPSNLQPIQTVEGKHAPSKEDRLGGKDTKPGASRASATEENGDPSWDVSTGGQDDDEKDKNASGRATETEELSHPAPNSKRDEGRDPRTLYEKAKATYKLSKEVLELARVYAKAPARLSDEFISCNFPFDRNDNHYVYCIICGLSGDLLCCDGCANVAHPSCAYLSEIPEGDWFCDQCEKKRSSSVMPQATSKKNPLNEQAHTTSGGDVKSGNDEDILHNGDSRPSELATRDTKISRGREADAKNSRGSLIVKTDNSEQSFPPPLPKVAEVTEMAAEVPSNTADGRSVGGSSETKGASLGSDHVVSATNTRNAAENSGTQPKIHQPSGSQVVDGKAVDATFSRMPPIVDFDENKAEQLKKGLDDLFWLRKGRPYGTKTEKAKQDSKSPGKGNGTDNDIQKLPSLGVGTKFVKKFGRYGLFKGEIIAVPSEEHPFFRAKYEDGDEEDLEENEIMGYMERWGHKLGKTRRKDSGKVAALAKSVGKDDGQETPTKEVGSQDDTFAGQTHKRPVGNLKSEEGNTGSEPLRKRSKSSKPQSKEQKDPFLALSNVTQKFLGTVGVSKAEEFLSRRTADLANSFIKWRAKNGMPVLKGTGAIASVSAWKTSVRNIMKERGLDTAKLEANRKRGRPSKETKVLKPQKNEQQDPILSLSDVNQKFLNSLGISKADDFLSRQTSELANSFIEWRAKNDMPVLKGTGAIASVSAWKTHVKNIMKEKGLNNPSSGPSVTAGFSSEKSESDGKNQETSQASAGGSQNQSTEGKRRRREPDRYVAPL